MGDDLALPGLSCIELCPGSAAPSVCLGGHRSDPHSLVVCQRFIVPGAIRTCTSRTKAAVIVSLASGREVMVFHRGSGPEPSTTDALTFDHVRTS